MIRELVTDKAVLSTPCEPGTAEDAELAQDLVDTLLSLDEAACLAANQIGVTKAIVAYKDDDDNAHVIYNLAMKRALHPSRVEEGCMSHEDTVRVTRFDQATFTYQELVDGELVDRKREYRGWMAQILQHMIDHCKGKLV